MLNTKYVMSGSAILLGALGIVLTLLPAETATYLGLTAQPMLTLLLQIMGGLYMGFAVLNWMAKGNLIGGIYSRPVALGNFAHYMIAGLAVNKAFFTTELPGAMAFIAGAYAIEAILFGVILFRHPLSDPKT
jgi:hypothetical protein